MLIEVIGCSHHDASIAIRERLAFSSTARREALDQWRRAFPGVEAVLLSTCNRVELYAAAEEDSTPEFEQVAGFVARFHKLDAAEFIARLYNHADEAAIKHLFAVTSSLDSMVLGEPQILAQVKDAYQAAIDRETAGPILHAAFQAALHVAHRVAEETAIHRRRVSVPSVAVADFARQVFERFDDKQVAVIGAGEMAEETLRYLQEEGVKRITVINRRFDRAEQLAACWHGRALPWEQLPQAMADADMVISATAAAEPIVTRKSFAEVESLRFERPLLILDLAVPRDFEPSIGDCPNVFLYSIDDLQAACLRNREDRDRELPAAKRIVEQEAARFSADIRHRAVGPIIEQLRQGWQKPKEDELERLLNKLPELDERAREEIRRSFDRLVNKLLHPPLESLRDESRRGVSHTLLYALTRLFQLKD
jgi:glutamyl-tRNA reductase